MGVESYKHKFAKAVLAGWLRRDGLRVFEEYPICEVPNGIAWGPWPSDIAHMLKVHAYGLDVPWGVIRPQWHGKVPSYDELCARNAKPSVIFDVAVCGTGGIINAYEVVHTNPISEKKFSKLKELHALYEFSVHTISAEWILRQVDQPDRLFMTRVL